jgi:hypothetical protein
VPSWQVNRMNFTFIFITRQLMPGFPEVWCLQSKSVRAQTVIVKPGWFRGLWICGVHAKSITPAKFLDLIADHIFQGINGGGGGVEVFSYFNFEDIGDVIGSVMDHRSGRSSNWLWRSHCCGQLRISSSVSRIPSARYQSGILYWGSQTGPTSTRAEHVTGKP